MATMTNPSSFFSGGGKISGNVDIEGELKFIEKALWGSEGDMTTRYDGTEDDYRWEDGINNADRAAMDRTTGDMEIGGEFTEGSAL